MQNEELDLLISSLTDINLQNNSLNTILNSLKNAEDIVTFEMIQNKLIILEEIYNKTEIQIETKKLFADLLSLLYITDTNMKCLHYRLQGGSCSITNLGSQYVRKINIDILQFYKENKTIDAQIFDLVMECVLFFINHNAECEAIDLLYEINREEEIVPYVNEHNYRRIRLYLQGLVNYKKEIHSTLSKIYKKMANYPKYILSLIKNNKIERAVEEFKKIEEKGLKKQICFIFNRLGIVVDAKDELYDKILKGEYNKLVYEFVCKDMDLCKKYSIESDIKSPRDKEFSLKFRQFIYLANAFINYGLEENETVSEKNERCESITVHLANGISHIFNSEKLAENYFNPQKNIDNFAKVGNLLAVAVANSKKADETATTIALINDLFDQINSATAKCALVFGIGMIYADTKSEIARAALVEHCYASELEVAALACFSLGIVFIGTADMSLVDLLLQVFITQIDNSQEQFFKFIILGISFLFFNKKPEDGFFSTLKEIKNPITKHLFTLVKTFSRVGSSNPLHVENILKETFFFDTKDIEEMKVEVENKLFKRSKNRCNHNFENETGEVISESLKKESIENKNERNESIWEESNYAVSSEYDETEARNIESLGILCMSVISLGNDLSSKMATRLFTSSLLLDSQHIKYSVPLALALLYASNPNQQIIDLLVKNFNYQEAPVVNTSAISLGMVVAGSNSTKNYQTLKTLITQNSKNSRVVSALTIAMGLCKLGKGSLHISPILYGDIINKKSFIGIFTLLYLSLDSKDSFLYRYPFFYSIISLAINSKYVLCIEEDNEIVPCSTNVRTGKPVDVVGTAGEQRSISGVQVNTSPVILKIDEVAECEDEAYTDIIEDVVVIKQCEKK
ncbi:MAG: hypothetical protein RR564_06780 [Eubacterium sp.]